jgi:Lipase maturation factor
LFASGSVKLASGCPHWWNLSALKHHLVTLPLPTNLAFYSYYLPDGYLKLTTIFVHLSELLCPWLFFAPVRSVRIFAFYWQVFLQISIIATGNYGFINFLVLTMLLSLLDDSHFQSNASSGNGINYKKVFSFILTMATIFFIFIITITFYKISWADGVIDATVRKFPLIEVVESFLKISSSF